MGILLLFNTHEKLTYAEISEKTKLTGDHLGASLSGIVSKEILSCSTPGKFEPTSVFCFNLKYKPKTTKPNVMQPDRQYLEKQEKQRTDEIEDELEGKRLEDQKKIMLIKLNEIEAKMKNNDNIKREISEIDEVESKIGKQNDEQNEEQN
jgi:hypothetical protein